MYACMYAYIHIYIRTMYAVHVYIHTHTYMHTINAVHVYICLISVTLT